MRVLRRIIFILVLLGLIFVVYRFFNPQGADSFLSKFKGNLDISQTTTQQEDEEDAEVMSGDVLSLKEDTITQTGENLTQSGEDTNEILALTSNMSGYREIVSENQEVISSGGPGYKDPDYDYYIRFPNSRTDYDMQKIFGKDIKSIITFGYSGTNYFKIYTIDLKYYIAKQKTEFSGLQYLDQDDKNAYLYKLFDYSKSKDPEIINNSKTAIYIIQTFRLLNITQTETTSTQTTSTQTTSTQTTPKPTTSAPTTPASKPTTTQTTTTPKPTTNQQDLNDAKSLFDNFIE
ncbi:hypothetical protein K9M48_00305 [Candidatus Gracilibacteria bacterium]|nr:hypothetical protein [Candidatus Gracilibacteria bacterium]